MTCPYSVVTLREHHELGHHGGGTTGTCCGTLIHVKTVRDCVHMMSKILTLPNLPIVSTLRVGR